MTTQFSLNLTSKAASIRRDTGIKRAADHAERVTDEWSARALALLQTFVTQRRGAPFLAEDFVAFTKFQIAAPPDARAWGSPMRAAARAGLIKKIGYAPAKTSNLSPKVQWQGIQ